MKILGNRVLVSKIEEEKKDGFQAVQVQDSFVNKGRVEDVGFSVSSQDIPELQTGSVILFAKYSPDTQEVEHEGKKMKIVNVDDILAIL